MTNGKNLRIIEISTVVKISKIILSVALLIFSTSIACASVNNTSVMKLRCHSGIMSQQFDPM